jgi:hypothetical protein
VKDLGALAYSALKTGATRADLLSAFKAYRNATGLQAGDKRLARQILRRVAWLCTRRPKYDADFEQLSRRFETPAN